MTEDEFAVALKASARETRKRAREWFGTSHSFKRRTLDEIKRDVAEYISGCDGGCSAHETAEAIRMDHTRMGQILKEMFESGQLNRRNVPRGGTQTRYIYSIAEGVE